MKIVILSGGSGNDALVKGLKKLYRNCEIKVITNAYDNGKSTGVCRAITNTLGVSDIRKNHTRMYKAMNDIPNMNYLEFYDKRYDIPKGKEVEFIVDLLAKWGLLQFEKFVRDFFNRKETREYEFKDFSIANIVYSEMYAQIGYEKTNKYFCDLLNIEDFVILNSFDNVFIQAKTNSGNTIEDEGDIVEYKNAKDPIVNIKYVGNIQDTINPNAIKAVEEANLIIISTGTFWSSIYPSLQYGDFYKYINESNAKKIWAMNNEEDKDSYGIGNKKFIEYFKKLGLKVEDFTILLNKDAKEILRQSCKNSIEISMDNNNGKHNGDKYAYAILYIYYGLQNIKNYNKMIFDFDDTIWSRKLNDPNKQNISIENIKLVNELKNAIIISGNSYNSIYEKLSRVYGSELNNFNVDIWADANAILYKNNKEIKIIDELQIKDGKEICNYLQDKYNIPVNTINKTYIKIKPLSNLERDLLVDVLNNIVFKTTWKNLKAFKTGSTTVDILNKNNDKSKVFDYLKLKDVKTIYIGDEIDSGNDKNISAMCSYSIRISDVEETNLLLRLIKRSQL